MTWHGMQLGTVLWDDGERAGDGRTDANWLTDGLSPTPNCRLLRKAPNPSRWHAKRQFGSH